METEFPYKIILHFESNIKNSRSTNSPSRKATCSTCTTRPRTKTGGGQNAAHILASSLQFTVNHVQINYRKQIFNIFCNPTVKEQGEEISQPLHDAARRGNLSFLKECLDSGVSKTGLDASGNTPLHWAARSGHLECVQELLAASTSPINVGVRAGCTILFLG